MKDLTLNNTTISLDNDGYLKNLSDWNKDVAQVLARDEQIELTENHWEVIELVREFYDTFELAPSQRPLVKFVKNRLGEEKGRSIYLMKLFPGSPARIVARIAGLPRPTNCF